MNNFSVFRQMWSDLIYEVFDSGFESAFLVSNGTFCEKCFQENCEKVYKIFEFERKKLLFRESSFAGLLKLLSTSPEEQLWLIFFPIFLYKL